MAQPGGHGLLQILFVYQPHDKDCLGQAEHQESHADDEVDTYVPQDGAGRETHTREVGEAPVPRPQGAPPREPALPMRGVPMAVAGSVSDTMIRKTE